ncbi:hypothetical protein F5Y16DRAFT_364802 [Xylariaceae sp. FL0255]|nr:hypothetical protein F5Y16DRAFT_364802 [Xylariaceae sp. FL0255]
MMEELKPATTHFALLVGVNSDNERPLKGCVHDVREITRRLSGSPLAKINIQLLTAESGNTTVASECTGVPELLATYSNMKAGLGKIVSSAKRGTYVYIHYSGHGVRTQASSEYSSRTTGDLALNVLEDVDTNRTTPFPGLELAYSLKDMVKNGVTVTTVLDCCFSGSVLRGRWGLEHNSVRYREYDHKAISPSHYVLEDCCKRTETSGTRDYRDASMLPNWLIYPEGHTVVTACGPQEIAMELDFPGQAYKHGALSYFILRAIDKLGGLGGKHAHIYPYLCSMFRQYHPTQNPMWYGNPSLCFFGEETQSVELTAAPFAVIWNGSCLKLQGGHAHGVCEGDEFAVYTIGSGRPLVTSKVNNVRALTSDMQLSDPEVIRNKRGYMAKALTHFSLRKYPVELCLSQSCVEDWRVALENRENLSFNDKEHPYAFHVSTDENDGSFQVRDGSGREIRCSPNELEVKTACVSPSRVLGIVERLAKFEMVKVLANKSTKTPFEGQYQVALWDSAGQEFQPKSTVSTNERDILRLVVQNHGSSTLYIHIYNLAPLGDIKNILKASYAVIPPRQREVGFTGEWSHRLGTVIPPTLSRKGICSCEDIVKVFITSHPTSFASLEMQELHDLHDRGMVEPSGKEQSLSSGTEDWVALNFRILTRKNPEVQDRTLSGKE